MNTRSRSKMGDFNELKALLEAVKLDLGGKIDKLTSLLEEKDKKIKEFETKVNFLEEKLLYCDKRYELLERKLDDSEQYSRRTSLRINGIPYNGKESGEESLQKVKDEVLKLGVNLADCEFDRAHRVGRVENGDVARDRQTIVKFATFRASTLVYRNRKKAVGERGLERNVKFYIDQTKRRFQLRKMAVEYVETKPLVDFVFVDVNCSLCIRFKNGEFKFFNSKEELINLVG